MTKSAFASANPYEARLLYPCCTAAVTAEVDRQKLTERLRRIRLRSIVDDDDLSDVRDSSTRVSVS